MTSGFGAVCDEFHVNCRLFLKLDLSLERESVLHFFDRLRKEYPGLKKLRRRGERCLVWRRRRARTVGGDGFGSMPRAFDSACSPRRISMTCAASATSF